MEYVESSFGARVTNGSSHELDEPKWWPSACGVSHYWVRERVLFLDGTRLTLPNMKVA